MTSSDLTGGQDDFFVASRPSDPTQLLQSIRTIKNAITKSEIKERKDAAESDEVYIVRLAIAYETVSLPLFRKRDDANTGRAAAWLGSVKQVADRAVLRSKSAYTSKFEVDDVEAIASLSGKADEIHMLPEILFQRHQIVLIFERAFTSMKLDGCTFRLPSGHPVVALSLRYARYDSFWFTLLHELAHVAMHYDSLDEPILDDLEANDASMNEIEANRLASNSLIPPAHARRLFRPGNAPDLETIFRFARDLKTHPSIIAGMYSYQMNRHALYSELINSIDVRKILGVAK